VTAVHRYELARSWPSRLSVRLA